MTHQGGSCTRRPLLRRSQAPCLLYRSSRSPGVTRDILTRSFADPSNVCGATRKKAVREALGFLLMFNAYCASKLGKRKRGSEDEADEEPTCPICLDELTKDVLTLGCGHVFHTFCMSDWCNRCQATNARCPICRRPLDTEALQAEGVQCDGADVKYLVRAFQKAVRRLFDMAPPVFW